MSNSPVKVLFWCHDCGVQAIVYKGHVTVPHKLDCEFGNTLYMRYPQLSIIPGSF